MEANYCTTILSCLFENNHSDRCKVISPCDLYLYFLEDWWCCAFFQLTLGHLCLIWKNDYSAPLVLFKLGFCFIAIVLYVVSLCILEISLLSDMACKYFLICRLPFSVYCSFFMQKIFSLMCPHLFIWTFVAWVLVS